jgi:hypothetical protein
MGYKLLDYTGNGYEVRVASLFLIDDTVPAFDAVLFLDVNLRVKAKARELLKTLPLKVETIVSHEPIILAQQEKELFLKSKTYEEIYLSQRLIWEGDWYIDDFGFYVYCYSFVADCEQLKDLRL